MVILAVVVALFLVLGLVIRFALRASLPRFTGTVRLAGLGAPVTITTDRLGIPSITARSRVDAFRALGYLTARDRLFQIDAARRLAAGRLSEVMGKATVAMDTNQRALGFSRAAHAIVAQLPEAQKEIILAYTQGINTFLGQMRMPPPEFLGLRYRPEPWTPEDTILVGLLLFQDLTETADTHERMMTVMEALLPREVVDFLTADEDGYTALLMGGTGARRPIQSIPVEALASLRVGAPPQSAAVPDLVQNDSVLGSNGWAVSDAGDGRAILVSDMHLRLSTPNIWYRVALHYDDIHLSGVIMPGMPMLVVGASERIAWGFTNLRGDVLDLVRLEINPANPDEYRTPDGWRRFDVVEEVIRVRGRKDVVVPVKQTIWGPVSQDLLMGQPVAVRWTALDAQAVDIGLIDMDRAETVEDALRVAQSAGLPPMNAMLADASGRIAWTICGKIPVRMGFDGAASQSWADGQKRWDRYIARHELPVLIDPPAGFLVTANNRTVGPEYPYVIGYNFSSGYRAHRITKLLREQPHGSEPDMFARMLDTASDFYDFYRSLALDLLTEDTLKRSPLLAEARQAITAWDSKADVESSGIAILVPFREALAKAVFSSYLRVCIEADENFSYAWNSVEHPLRQLLAAKIPQTLPEQYPDWEALIVGELEGVCRQLKGRYRVPLTQLTWGAVNRAAVGHLLALALPPLGRLLSMPRDPLPGCAFSICVATRWMGSSLRMAVAPGSLTAGLMHMPGGQSGHPLSPHYKDQHSSWVRGKPLPLMPGPSIHTLELIPESSQPRHA